MNNSHEIQLRYSVNNIGKIQGIHSLNKLLKVNFTICKRLKRYSRYNTKLSLKSINPMSRYTYLKRGLGATDRSSNNPFVYTCTHTHTAWNYSTSIVFIRKRYLQQNHLFNDALSSLYTNHAPPTVIRYIDGKYIRKQIGIFEKII